MFADDVRKAEVLWALKCVASHYSYTSSNGSDKLFSLMFPDSKIAQSFTCGRDKIAYLIYFGLAPFFQNALFDKLKTVSTFVILFDETLNKFTQTKQMDLYVRFWHDEAQIVITKYFGSLFLGHATADVMKTQFLLKCSNLNLNRLFQLSMDGQNVNWSFYSKVMEEIFGNTVKAVDIGSCGLHVVHNSFRAGFEAAQWNLNSFLTSLYFLFHDTPARREDYFLITNSNVLPLKFCPHRWVENAKVAERAQQIFPDVVKYCEAVSKSNSRYKAPTCKSFEIVRQYCQDPLLPSKLALFDHLALCFNEFLVLFQSDKPMVPFLANEVAKLIKDLCKRFVKKENL